MYDILGKCHFSGGRNFGLKFEQDPDSGGGGGVNFENKYFLRSIGLFMN